MTATPGEAHRDAQDLAIEQALRSFGDQQRRLDEDREPLVLAALARGFSRHRIYRLSGIARTTINRIIKRTKEQDDHNDAGE